MTRKAIEPLERFRGAMFGLAVGDALGAPLAGMKAGHVQQVYGPIDGFVDPAQAWEGRPHRWSRRGLYTTNTQRAMLLADVLARDHACDPQALVDAYLGMAEADVEGLPHGCHRRVGRALHAALGRMGARESHPLDCGAPVPDSAAAAAIAPAGLYFASDPDPLLACAIESALVTHRDARAVAAALAVALAVARMARDPAAFETPPGDLARDLAAQVRGGEDLLVLRYGRHLADFGGPETAHQISDAIALLARLLDEGDDKLAFDSIVRQANRFAPDHEIHDPGDAFAPAGLTTALYLALGGRSFTQAVPRAVEIGREAHDAGAIVGAIVGARDGAAMIPPAWIAGLRNADQIDLRGESLLRGEIDYTRWRGIVDLEAEATAEEERERRALAALWAKKGLLVQKKPRPKQPAEEPEDEPEFAPPPEVWLFEKEQEKQRRREKERDRDKQLKRERRARKKDV